MKEITQAVLDGTYDRPLGRGLLSWRIMQLDEEAGETKHIVELTDGVFAYLRKCQGQAILTDLDAIYDKPMSAVGLPEVLGVQHVMLFSSRQDDELPTRLGLTRRAVRTRKAGGFDAPCPEGFESDVVLTDEESKRLFDVAKDSETMKVALSFVGRGASFICRYTSPFGNGLMIIDRFEDSPKSLTLNTFHVLGTQDIFPMLDGYNYLVSKAEDGFFDYPIEDNGMSGPIAQYMEHLGFKPYSNTYVISATPKGENNVH